MITEDYVSFETAKLLKEKGFDSECHSHYYPCHRPDGSVQYHIAEIYSLKSLKDFYLAPTLQMAMKWLREVHNLFVDIYYDYDFREGYKFSIHKLTKGTTLETNNENYSTYEQACDKAIKYCLENLM